MPRAPLWLMPISPARPGVEGLAVVDAYGYRSGH
jgi:hypothetical protein